MSRGERVILGIGQVRWVGVCVDWLTVCFMSYLRFSRSIVTAWCWKG